MNVFALAASKADATPIAAPTVIRTFGGTYLIRNAPAGFMKANTVIPAGKR